ncbi:MAG: cyclic pyranopterin monophosphate synthase MoaC [FCB group bacterium]|nr:cyclic pyranopterin monophosphate synthase MoaC [FCB group bacterium]
MSDKKLTHTNAKGEARMVDVGGKPDSERYARASGRVHVSAELLARLRENSLKKGDALAAARIAGILAAKKTAEIIPLCHTLPLTSVSVELTLNEESSTVEIMAETRTNYKTGVEMEALVAVSTAALTIYDMGKAIDKNMTIEAVRLLEKSGGQSGHWLRKDA